MPPHGHAPPRSSAICASFNSSGRAPGAGLSAAIKKCQAKRTQEFTSGAVIADAGQRRPPRTTGLGPSAYSRSNLSGQRCNWFALCCRDPSRMRRHSVSPRAYFRTRRIEARRLRDDADAPRHASIDANDEYRKKPDPHKALARQHRQAHSSILITSVGGVRAPPIGRNVRCAVGMAGRNAFRDPVLQVDRIRSDRRTASTTFSAEIPIAVAEDRAG